MRELTFYEITVTRGNKSITKLYPETKGINRIESLELEKQRRIMNKDTDIFYYDYKIVVKRYD